MIRPFSLRISRIAGTCTPKGVFVDISRERVPEKAVLGIYWQGLMDSNHRMTESESVALPLGGAPIKKGPSLVRCTQCVLSAEGLYQLGRS